MASRFDPSQRLLLFVIKKKIGVFNIRAEKQHQYNYEVYTKSQNIYSYLHKVGGFQLQDPGWRNIYNHHYPRNLTTRSPKRSIHWSMTEYAYWYCIYRPQLIQVVHQQVFGHWVILCGTSLRCISCLQTHGREGEQCHQQWRHHLLKQTPVRWRLLQE